MGALFLRALGQRDAEEEPGLGNGGLGRLAACFMESLATLRVPAIGYGIRYEFGIFDQAIRGGEQVEVTDKWLRGGNPWEIARPEITFEVKFGGHSKAWTDERGRRRYRWIPDRVVQGVAYDTPILGYRVNTVDLLRLWKAEACESFDFQAFNVGDYYRAVQHKVQSETITKVLYPNDEPETGRRLRLLQQYFFVSCSLQDMVRIFGQCAKPITQVTYGSPEQNLGMIALTQLGHFYNLPIYGLGGGVGAKVPDADAASEAMMSLLLNSLAGMTLNQSLGTLSFGMYGSQEMVVICDEQVHMIKRILEGINISEDTLALDVIRSVGHGGDFLSQDHTVEHFRKEVFFPNLFRRQTLQEWERSGSKMAHQVAHERVFNILETAGPVNLPPGVDAEMERALHKAIRFAEARAQGG